MTDHPAPGPAGTDAERLAEIERDHALRCPILEYEDGDASLRQVDRAILADDVNVDHCDIVYLLARLRAAEQRADALLAAGTALFEIVRRARFSTDPPEGEASGLDAARALVAWDRAQGLGRGE